MSAKYPLYGTNMKINYAKFPISARMESVVHPASNRKAKALLVATILAAFIFYVNNHQYYKDNVIAGTIKYNQGLNICIRGHGIEFPIPKCGGDSHPFLPA